MSGRHRGPSWWMDALFVIGSACFALGAAPGFSSAAAPETVANVFFVGSIFFTSAAATQYWLAGERHLLTWRPRDLAWLASIVQLAGTLWFNLNTWDARDPTLDAQQENLRVWTPDMIGSVCFLVASGLAVLVVGGGRRPWAKGREGWVATLNLLGSVFFMVSALAAYALPDTGDLLDATLVNSGTFLGALCFLIAARMEITLSG